MLYLTEKMQATGDIRLENESIRQLFHSFTMRTATLSLAPGEKNTLVFGKAEIPTLSADAEYAYRVTREGASLVGADYNGLVRGLFDLLMQIEWKDASGKLFIRRTEKTGVFSIKNRMVHFCVFPETPLLYLKKLIRFAAALQFTHVILEFWGMLRYDTLPALAWENAYTKEEIREVIREMRELGVEPIPMLNSLGHASQSRGCSGKHAVLDRDPSLYRLYLPDGGSWNTESPEVRELLKKLRLELYDLFGDGEYFHLGLDESYMHAKNPELFRYVPEYLSYLTKEVCAEGRRPMIWMDMFLPVEAYTNVSHLDCTKLDGERFRDLLSSISPDTVLVDWQYFVRQSPISTSAYLKDSGFAVMGAPWLDGENGVAHIETVKQYGLHGVMLTTWHTVSTELSKMLYFARHFGAAKAPWSDFAVLDNETGTLLRKLTWEDVTYAETGWQSYQTHIGPVAYVV